MSKNKQMKTIRIYSDASCSPLKDKHNVGISSVMLIDDIVVESRGESFTSTTGASDRHELEAIKLSFDLLTKVSRRKKLKNCLCILHSDNTQAISNITNSESFFDILTKMKEFGHSISINYCSGNEPFHNISHILANSVRKKLISSQYK